MTEVMKKIRILAAHVNKAAARVARSPQAAAEEQARLLLEMQRKLDVLREAVWEARKTCDPNLTPPHIAFVPRDASLTERVVFLVDKSRKTGAA